MCAWGGPYSSLGTDLRGAAVLSKQHRGVLVAIIVAAIGLAGIVVVNVGTDVYAKSCMFNTKLDNDPGWEFIEKDKAQDIIYEELPEAFEDLLGVTELFGVVKVPDNTEVVEGFGDDILIVGGKDQGFDEVGTERLTSINPRTGTISWSRTALFEMHTPKLAGENVVTYGAVQGRKSRVMVLDGATGKVKGCADLEYYSGFDMFAITLDSEQVVVASENPDTDETIVTSTELSNVEEKWQVMVPRYGEDRTITSFDNTIAVGHFEHDLTSAVALDDNGDIDINDIYRRVFTGLDSETGEEKWVWPTKQIETQYVRTAGELILGQTGNTPLVVSAAFETFTQDFHSDTVEFIVAIDPDTGKELWRVQDSFSYKQIFGDIIVLKNDEKIMGVDANTGKTKWTQSFSDKQGSSSDSSFWDEKVGLNTAISWGDLVMVMRDNVATFDSTTGEILTNIDATSFIRAQTRASGYKPTEVPFSVFVDDWWATPGLLTAKTHWLKPRSATWILCFEYEQ